MGWGGGGGRFNFQVKDPTIYWLTLTHLNTLCRTDLYARFLGILEREEYFLGIWFSYLGYNMCINMWWSMIMYLLCDVKQKDKMWKVHTPFSWFFSLRKYVYFYQNDWVYQSFRIYITNSKLFNVHIFILCVNTFTKRRKRNSFHLRACTFFWPVSFISMKFRTFVVFFLNVYVTKDKFCACRKQPGVIICVCFELVYTRLFYILITNVIWYFDEIITEIRNFQNRFHREFNQF